jgi:hypothetical protein
MRGNICCCLLNIKVRKRKAQLGDSGIVYSLLFVYLKHGKTQVSLIARPFDGRCTIYERHLVPDAPKHTN